MIVLNVPLAPGMLPQDGAVGDRDAEDALEVIGSLGGFRPRRRSSATHKSLLVVHCPFDTAGVRLEGGQRAVAAGMEQ